MINLFQTGNFSLNSGRLSEFKIECDALTDDDIATFAYIISQKYTFGQVHGVPTGGIRLEKALEKYIDPSSPDLLIVDDVLTTGGSMERARDRALSLSPSHIYGVVLFAREQPPAWIEPIFMMWR